MSVKLVREGEGAEEAIEIRLTQLTPQAVCSLFSISIDTVWLREQSGARAFFPNLSKTSFDVPNDVDCFIAMGTPSDGVVSSSQTQPSGSGFSMPILSGTTRSVLCPSRPVFNKKSIDGGTANVKIVQAHFVKSAGKGPNKFLPTTEQIFVPVKESTANVLHVTEVMQDSWGTEYVLITSDGLRIQDSVGTRGLSFWRVGSRKIFAVTKDDLSRFGGKGRSDKRKRDHVIELSSSDDENPRMKAKLMTKLEELLEEMKHLRSDVNNVMKLTKGMNLPPGLYSKLQETFSCSVCRSSPYKTPVIFSRCCRNIIGCSECVDRWFKDNSTCPLCRSERALPDTCIVNGLEDFIAAISPLMKGQDSPAHVPTPPPLSTRQSYFDMENDDDGFLSS